MKEKNMHKEFQKGVRLAASVAKDYDKYSSHDHLVSDCILVKLNVTERRAPRKNPKAGAEWLRGFGTALSEMQNRFDQASLVHEVMKSAGVRLSTLKKAGLSEYDLGVLTRAVWGRRARDLKKARGK
jgi:hypothetical protein